MKEPNLTTVLPIEAMKSQIQAAAMHSILSPKNKLGTFTDAFMKEKNVKKIKMPDFLDWLVDKIPPDTTYNIVKGKIVFKDLPPFGTKAKEPNVFEEDSLFEF